MSGMILGLLAETFVHPGSGQTGEGAIDLPVAREKPTEYPFIPGSSVKGALREAYQEAERNKLGSGDDARRAGEKAGDSVFGTQERSGDMQISDARLLLLPVRSLTGAYRWLTCPHLIERFRRDCRRAIEKKIDVPDLTPPRGEAIVAVGAGALYLEERHFKAGEDKAAIDKLATAIGDVVADAGVRGRLGGQLAIVADNDFTWFARYALAVNARNQLDENKTSQNLWYEESLPPDTLLYSLAFTVRNDPLAKLQGLFGTRSYLRLGGNETVGQGWFQVACIREAGKGGGNA